MTTTPTQDPAVTTIDHLDFEIPCYVHNRKTDDACEQPADWWAILRHHCKPDATIQALWCADHHDQIMAGTPHLCPTCREPINIKPLIIRTERIR